MSVFFERELDTAASFWRIYRPDGVTLGFTSHDQDLSFGGINHSAAPGMVPTAIRKTSGLSDESAGVDGALTHDTISSDDLMAGLYDYAAVEIGIVDWESRNHHVLYSGTLGEIEDDGMSFSGELRSAKQILDYDLVPRTSPTCRAEFCGLGCGLSAPRFTRRVLVSAVDHNFNRIFVPDLNSQSYVDGTFRFLEGAQTGLTFAILSVQDDWLVLDRPLSCAVAVGLTAELREGCDHTVSTCESRFANAKNFRGEPFLPGNDLLARYGQSS